MLADCDGGDESSLLLCSQSLHNLFTASPCTAPSNWRYNRYTMRRPLSFFVTFDIHLFNDLAIGHTGAAYAMYAVIGSLLLNHVRSHRLRIVSKEKEMVTPFMNGRERERERESGVPSRSLEQQLVVAMQLDFESSAYTTSQNVLKASKVRRC